jgi:GYF domain 2
MKTYYIGINGESKGPYVAEQILTMWNSGSIQADALYFNESLNEWKPLADIISELSNTAKSTKANNLSEPIPITTTFNVFHGTLSAMVVFAVIIFTIFGIKKCSDAEEKTRKIREQAKIDLNQSFYHLAASYKFYFDKLNKEEFDYDRFKKELEEYNQMKERYGTSLKEKQTYENESVNLII